LIREIKIIIDGGSEEVDISRFSYSDPNIDNSCGGAGSASFFWLLILATIVAVKRMQHHSIIKRY